MKKIVRFILYSLIFAAGLIEVAGVFFVARFSYGVNEELISGNPADFYWKPSDRGIKFSWEDKNLSEMEYLRKNLAAVIKDKKSDFDKAIAIRRWVRNRIKFGKPESDSDWNPIKILKDADEGKRFFCDEYAAVFAVSSYSAGLFSRVIHVKSSKGKGHFLNEVWLKEYNKWAIMDALFNCTVVNTENMVPASALEIHQSDKNIFKVERQNSNTLPNPFSIDYLDYFDNFSIVLSNDFITRPQKFFPLLLSRPRKFLAYTDDKRITKMSHSKADKRKMWMKITFLALNIFFIVGLLKFRRKFR